MGRPKMFDDNYELPTTVVNAVKAICQDFFRRERLIKQDMVSGDTADNYIKLNGSIERALHDTLEDEYQMIMFDDIIKSTGYDNSKLSDKIGYQAYYRRKRKAIYTIAKYLLLY